MAGSKQTVTVEGRRLQLSNLDKVLYPETGTTKGEVLAYYGEIAPVMLPHCRDRAATRKRWPNGVEGTVFFQKDIGDGAPDWVELRSIQHSDHVNRYPLVNDLPTLTWLAQLAALEIHVPQWRFGDGDERLPPDRLVLDLDPGPGVGLRECADVARLARRILSDMGLDSVPVTSGSKGIHMYAPLDGRQTSDQVSRVARELARALEADHPDDIVSSMQRAKRAGKVFIDWSQNNGSKTTIAPYSLRGRERPTVAAPRSWRELASPALAHLDFREVLARVARRGDPMAGLEERARERAGRDRLAVYRSKRDRSRTPEPVPEAGEADGDADGDPAVPVFVIQRHEARRLHYDFRIEHDGVLVSWALPKGPPTDPKRNHLAVQTEDHPMSYRFFEGTIPRGEYGAGEVRIWDAGTVEIEKWRDDEVIVTLTGSPGGGLGGRRRYALFRTDADPQKPQWMIHLMQDRDARDEPRAAPGPAAAPPRRAGPVGSSADGSADGSAGGSEGGSGGGSASRRARTVSVREPREYRPMLARRGSEAGLGALDDEWAFEMKWDGIRAVVSVDPSGVTVRTRSGADVSHEYPELGSLGHAISAEDAVLDGEIVAFDARGVPSFGRLQQRMNLTKPREISSARARVPVVFVAFDLLRVNGRSCVSLPYHQRRELLAEVVEEGSPEAPVTVPPAFEGDAEGAMAASRQLGLEGIMAKRQDGVYHPGVRSPDWLKFPRADTAEVVVIGWRVSEAEPGGIASLLVAVPGPDGLQYAGRVGTGFSSEERRAIRSRLLRAERRTPPVEVPAVDRRDARWVTPRLVGEVTFRERTADGRLRHSAWRGWRPDKGVGDVNPPAA